MNRFVACLSAAVAVSAAGCGGDDETVGSGPPPGGGGGDSGVVDGSTINPFVDGGGLPDGSSVVMNCTDTDMNADQDSDGFSAAQGDCNDCDKSINPGAYDFPGNQYDEDCSGGPAMAVEDCDNGLAIDSNSAEDAARALGLCKFTTADKKDWGVISARFTTADGSGKLDSPMQVGLLPTFGEEPPRAGKSFLALSSGVARAPGQPGYTDDYDDNFGQGILSGKPGPAGYPKASSACGGTGLLDKVIYNQAALELKIRVPTNANSLKFDNIFYSYEYPEYICEAFNDFFITLLEPKDSGDGNIVFDSNKDPIGVNSGLLAVCDPKLQNPSARKQFTCDQGIDLLKGTGYAANEYSYVQPSIFGEPTTVKGKGAASTGWLTTVSPVKAGQVITIRFAVWDTGDPNVDSTALIDRFEWSVNMPTGASTVATPVLL